ncbi:MAG: hypothetical protein IKB07_06240 [Lachnospiraceae bacterium]|nr:hypothetical protein [Lachnospiraceae bacterium]
MLERIICLFCCLLCAFPLFVVSKYDKDGSEPIGFWTNDKSLKSKVKNVHDYNREMAALYKKYAYALVLAGVGGLIHMMVGLVLLGVVCTVGIWLLYCGYKRILSKYS